MAPVATRLKPRGTWHVRFHFPHVKSTGFWTLFAPSGMAEKRAKKGVVFIPAFYGKHVWVHASVRCIPLRISERVFARGQSWNFAVSHVKSMDGDVETLQRHFHSIFVQNFRDGFRPNSDIL